MRGGLGRPLFVAASAWLAACSTIIGLNEYDVDPALEPRPTGSAGEPAAGAAGGAGVGGAGEGGASAIGGANGTELGGAGGSGDRPPSCVDADCDDTIDCTEDACDGDGACTHTPRDEACDSSRCETCTAGIGCVAGDKTELQLLVDPSFDELSPDWRQSSARFGQNIFPDAAAHSPELVARFGPALADATAAEYADLLQHVTIPPGAAAVTLKGYYKLEPGPPRQDDYVVVGLWNAAAPGVTADAQFHAFHAADGAQSTWKAFSYALSKKQVQSVAGKDYSFDLVANVWDSVYQFDTLELNATLCK